MSSRKVESLNNVMANKKPRMQTPLHNAIRNGEKDFIEKLFQYDYVNDIEVTDELGLTPLHMAILCKNDAIAKLLIDNGANVNAKSNEEEVLPEIKKAIKEAKVKSMYYGTSDLLKYCTNLTPLHIATINGSLNIVSLLIENGAIVNIENGHNLRPIHTAIHSGFVDIVLLLFKNDAQIGNIQAPDFLSPDGLLACAADDGNAEVIEILLQKGIQAKTERAFLIALDLGHFDVVKVLVNNGAVINVYGTHTMYPPLHRAALFNDDEFKMLKLLVEHGADLEVFGGDEYDKTVLHMAATKGNYELAKYMIQNGANLDCETGAPWSDYSPAGGSTPLHLAIYEGNNEIAKMLIRAGADLNIPNSWTKTPLHYAVEDENIEMIQVLIKNGADVEAWFECESCMDEGSQIFLDDDLGKCCAPKPYEHALENKEINGMKSLFYVYLHN